MQICLNQKNNDITDLVGSIIWSGDIKQVARKLTFTCLYQKSNKMIPKVVIKVGDIIYLKDKKCRMIGMVFAVEKTAKSEMRTFTVIDFLHYIVNSDISRKFKATPKTITKAVCNELDVAVGTLADPKYTVKMTCFGKSAYSAIMMAYTYAAKKNKKKYMPLMDGTKLNVIEKGKSCKVTLEPEDIEDATFKASLENMVNKVIVTNKKHKKIDTIEDKASQKKYGTVQKVYQKEDKKSYASAAKAMLQDREETATINVGVDYPDAIAGYSLYVHEKNTGLYGKFYIAADTHSYSSGSATMSLTLDFENVMDKVELENEKNS